VLLLVERRHKSTIGWPRNNRLAGIEIQRVKFYLAVQRLNSAIIPMRIFHFLSWWEDLIYLFKIFSSDQKWIYKILLLW